MSTFGNLTLAGLSSGGVYAVFALCFVLFFRSAGILNLAVGDFAVAGALGTAFLAQREHLNLVLAIVVTLAAVGAFSWLYDWLVLRMALQGRVAQEKIIVVFFFTFGLSFFLENVGEHMFGTDVNSAPALWPGSAVTVAGLHIERAALLTIALAIVCGGCFAAYLRWSLRGMALSASGQNPYGARAVGVRQASVRRWMFVAMGVLAGIFGIVVSPINGVVYSTGASLSLFGLIAAAFAGFNRPARAVIAGTCVGLTEAYLGGYVSTKYQDTLLYAVLVLIVLIRPQVLGADPLATG